jgi:hypothetical protein
MRKLMTSLAAGAVLAMALAPAAHAQMTRWPIDAYEFMTGIVSPGSTSTHGNVETARGMVGTAAVTGSDLLEGTDTISINYNLNTATGSGALWGRNVIEPSAYPDGSFQCSWVGIFDHFVWTGRAVCHGTGSLAGWQLRLAILAEPGGMADTLTGVAFTRGA